MNDQYPGERQQPASEPGHDAASGPAPVTSPDAAHPAPAAAQQPAPVDSPAYPAPAAAQPPAGAAPGWGAPVAAPRNPQADKPWTVKRGLAVGGVAAVIAVGAGAGVYALTSSSAAASGDAAGQRLNGQGMPGGQQGGQAGGSATGRDGGGNFGPGGMGAMAGGLSAAVHADYVVLEGSTYSSMAEQLGTVSEVNSASVTVKSSDGFTRSYALGSDVTVSNMQQRRQQSGGTGSTGGSGTQLSVADIVSGATVRITAAKDGSGYTAKSVMLVAATATGQSN